MVNPMVQVLAAWAGALGFSILFNLRGKKIVLGVSRRLAGMGSL